MDRSRLLMGVGAVIVLVAVSGCVEPVAAPVCRICDGEVATDGHGTHPDEPVWNGLQNVTEERSELHIRFHRDGTTRWTARLRLAGSGRDRLRSVPDLETWVEEHRSTGPPSGDIQDLQTRFDGEMLVVTYETTWTVTEGPRGVLLMEELFVMDDVDGRPAYRLGADRVVLHAPPGMAITNHPTETTRINDSAVAWSATGEYEAVAAHTYLAFGPDRTPETWAASQLTVGRAVAGWALRPLTIVAAILELFVLVLAGLVVLGGTDGPITIRPPDIGGGSNADVEFAGRRRPSVSLNHDAIRFPWEMAIGFVASLVIAVAVAGSFVLRIVAWLTFFIPVVPSLVVVLLGPVATTTPRTRRGLIGFLIGTPLVASIPPVLSFGGGGLFLVPLWLVGVVYIGGPLMGLGWVGTKVLIGNGRTEP